MRLHVDVLDTCKDRSVWFMNMELGEMFGGPGNGSLVHSLVLLTRAGRDFRIPHQIKKSHFTVVLFGVDDRTSSGRSCGSTTLEVQPVTSRSSLRRTFYQLFLSTKRGGIKPTS